MNGHKPHALETRYAATSTYSKLISLETVNQNNLSLDFFLFRFLFHHFGHSDVKVMMCVSGPGVLGYSVSSMKQMSNANLELISNALDTVLMKHIKLN